MGRVTVALYRAVALLHIDIVDIPKQGQSQDPPWLKAAAGWTCCVHN